MATRKLPLRAAALTAALIASGMLSPDAQAKILFGQSKNVKEAPNFWYNNTEKNETKLLAFDERQNVEVSSGSIATQKLNQWDDTTNLIQEPVAKGVRINSHMLYFQKQELGRKSIVAEVEFDGKIVGFLGDGYLFGIDNKYFAPNATKMQIPETPNKWSLEEGASWTPLDKVTLLSNTRIRVEFTNQSAMDPLRVYTIANGSTEPEPPTPKPEPPTDAELSATVDGSTVTLNWDSLSLTGFTNCRIYRDGQIIDWWEVDAQFEDFNVSPGSYTYEVVYWNNNAKTELLRISKNVTVDSPTTPPTSGDPATATQVGDTIQIDWPDYSASNFNNFRIYRDGEILSWWVLESQFVDDTISSNVAANYSYRVVAWDNTAKVELAVWNASVSFETDSTNPTPPSDNPSNIYIEAEEADNSSSSGFSPFQVQNIAAASGGKVIVWPNNGSNQIDTTPANNDSGIAEYAITLAENTPTLDVYVLANGASTGDDSCYIKLDGHENNWNSRNNLRGDGFEWFNVGSYSNVSKGDYTLKILKREDGFLIDRLFISTDGSKP